MQAKGMYEGMKSRLIERAVIEGGEDLRIVVGVFENEMQPPILSVEVDTDNDEDIKSSLVRIDKSDEYQLIYYFQNFSSQAHEVVIREEYV